MRIIVGAVISRSPLIAGSVWNRIHRLIGLQRLGHEVFFVEEVTPNRCVDANGKGTDFEHCVNRSVFCATMERFGVLDRACQIYNQGEATVGLSRASLVAMCKEADLLFNMSGHVASDIVLDHVKRRVYVDEDPVYTQLWHAEYGVDLNFDCHDAFLSVGLNIGTPACCIPDCGVKWGHFLPPVILDWWPASFDASRKTFSTIAAWNQFGDLAYRGEWYRSKAHELKRFAELPRQAKQAMEIVLQRPNNEETEINRLRQNGWIVSEPSHIGGLTGYQQFIQGSRAEIGIAKHAYVNARSGWFSDRSAHYLASGRPVLAQSTGVEGVVPCDRGFVTFDGDEEAVAGVEAINGDYEAHCRAAREFAAEYLDYRKVLPKMIESSLCS
jgi:hypothetical protein